MFARVAFTGGISVVPEMEASFVHTRTASQGGCPLAGAPASRSAFDDDLHVTQVRSLAKLRSKWCKVEPTVGEGRTIQV